MISTSLICVAAGGEYSPDQLLNISAFSLLRRWLITTVSSGAITAPSPSPAPTPTLDHYRGQVGYLVCMFITLSLVKTIVCHIPIIHDPFLPYRLDHLRQQIDSQVPEPLPLLTLSPRPSLPPSPPLSFRRSASPVEWAWLGAELLLHHP